MQNLLSFLRSKPTFFLWITLGYILFISLLKWNVHPVLNTALFLSGAFIGMYFLEAAERFFHLTPSPFRSIVFVVLFSAVSFFVVTSSGSYIATGLVLTVFLTLLLWQCGEWSTVKHLHRWYLMLAEPVSPKTELLLLWIGLLFFVLQTIIFIQRT